MKRSLAIGLLLALTGATPLVAGKLDVGDRVVVKFTAAGQLIVRDGLVIDGEAIFTSENDDANGGAIHPTAASPNPGDWMGVRLERSSPSSLTQLAGLRVLFAGNGVPAVALRDTSIALAGFSVEQAAGVGLGVTSQTSSALSQLVLTGNDVGLSVDAGATLSLSGAFIGGNTTFGALNLDPSNPLTISSTWWGHPSGPLDASDDTGTGGLFNPNGLGNAVSDGILYDPASQLIPLIGASIEPLDGSLAVQQDVTFRLRSLTAVAAKLNEDDTFPASTFETLTPTRVLTLSPGDGLKTVFARFQAATGNTQDVSTQLTLDVSAPNVIVTNPNPGDVIGRPITVTVQATDVTGVDRVDFLVDGVLVFSDTTNAFSFDWDVRPLTDGPHELSAIGIDTVGHAQRVDVAVIVSVLSPAPPVITSPAAGSTLAKDTVAVSGTAEPQSTITVYVNVISAGQVLTDGTGNWSLAGVLLAEGVSTITATASDTGGISQPSAGVMVTVDTGPPDPPLFLTFLDLPDGVKRFDWVESLDFDQASYNLYRATTMFTTTAGATQIQTGIVRLDTEDTPPTDGIFFYGVTGVDLAGNEGALSAIVQVTADTTLPTAAVSFLPVSPVGPGMVALTLVTSEETIQEPFLSVTPLGGVPTVIDLASGGDSFTWTGVLDVTSATPHGTAVVAFSARDMALNLGTVLTAGNTLNIDTRGPQGAIALTPAQAVYGPGNYTVDLTLDEPSVADPVLRFAPPTGAPFALALTGAGTDWQATLTIEVAHGDGSAGFELDADDSFGNMTSAAIVGAEIALDVTPLPAPTGLTATTLPAGEIQVDWDPVAGAASYHLRRAVAGAGIDPASAPLVTGLLATFHVDLPPADGDFEYATTALDPAGNESPLSNVDTATSDRTPPGDPVGLNLTVEGDGIRADWTPDAGVPADSFSLYRSLSVITTLTGLQPVQAGLTVPTAFDQPPADGDYFYVVVGLDTAGNASNFAAAGPLTFDQAPPMITVTGVADGEITNVAVTITFSAADLSLDTLSAMLDGQPFSSGSIESTAGSHTLVVDAADTSGNASQTTIAFVIDLTPPLIDISGVTDGQTANVPVTPVVTITEDNPGTSTITLNSNPFVSGTTVIDDGTYTLNVDATDAGGNTASVQIAFTIDGPPPPVGDLELQIQDGQAPQISWTAPVAGDIAGYDVSRDGVLLTNPSIATTNYQDLNFDPFATQTYEVVARDALGQSSPPATVTFTPITLTLGESGLNGMLTRRYLDEISVDLGNAGDTTLSNVRLDMTLLDGAEVLGARTIVPGFNIIPGATFHLDDVFSSGAGSADTRTLELDLTFSPGGGSTMRYLKTEVLPVREPPPAIEIFTEPVILGATASFRLKLLNHGSADLQVRTSEDGGPTNDIEVVVSDLDGNLLGSNTLEQFDGGVFNLPNVSIADLPPGGSFFTNAIDIPIPSNAPEQIVVEAFVHETHYDLFGLVPDVVGPELASLDLVGTGDPPYLAEAATDKVLYDQGEAVIISGRAFDPDTLVSVPDVEVKVGIHTRGFDRFLSVMSDGNGDFLTFFKPIPGEAGNYTAWATHPIVVERGSQAEFEIVGLRLRPNPISLLMSKAASFPLNLTLENAGENPQSGLTFSFLSGNGVSGAVDPATVPSVLGPGDKTTLRVDITTEPVADDANFLLLTIDSAEGASVTLDVSLELLDPFPAIATTPSFVELGMGNEELATRTVRIDNRGFEALADIVIEPPTTPWIMLGVDPNLPPIPPGGFADVPVIFAPDANVTPGIYSDKFVIHSSNHPPYIENLFAIVTSSQTGRAIFEVRNTEDVLLPGASVWIQSLQVPSLIIEQETDALGQTTFEELPAGTYQYRVQATGTQPSVDNFKIDPDQTTAIAVFNNVVYVTLNWSVTPVIINDRYDFKLEATFETFVPAPVLITDPLDFTIELLPGDTFYGEYTLKNLGLIAVDDVVISTAAGGGMVLDTLVDRIDRLGAREEITIPFRLMRPFPEPSAEEGTIRAETPNIADLCAPLPARIQQIGGYTCRAGFRTFTGAYVRITVRIPTVIVTTDAQDSLLEELKLCSNECSLCGIIGSCAGAFGGNVAAAAAAACTCMSSLGDIEDLSTATTAACDCISAVTAAAKAKAEAAGQELDDSGLGDTCTCLAGWVPGQNPLDCLEQGGGFLEDLADVTGKLKSAFRCGREIGDCICWLIPELCQLPTFTFPSITEGGGPPQPTSGGTSGSFTSGPATLSTGDYEFSFPAIQLPIECDNFPPGSVP